MARRITEEKLTKTILDWLESNDWEIVAYDFPQSGTGILLHSQNKEKNSKNKGGFIPDIVAIKNKIVVIFENKDRFVFEDYNKINYLKNTTDYNDSITKLLSGFSFKNIYYGIGLPTSKINKQKDKANWTLIDFTIMVNQQIRVEIIYDPEELF